MSFKYLGSLYMKTGTKNRTRIINNDSCQRGIGYNVSEALIVLWLLKCCDTGTSLLRKGKLKALSMSLRKNDWDIPEKSIEWSKKLTVGSIFILVFKMSICYGTKYIVVPVDMNFFHFFYRAKIHC